MRILIVTQYFWPESFIVNQLSSTLVLQGHEVTVLTGKPNYPQGKIYQGYEIKGVQKEKWNDVDVFRVPLRPRNSNSARDLLLNYLSFVWSGVLRFPELVKGKEFEFIFVFTPSPITSVIPAIFLKYLKRTHLAVWVQDLWPQSLSATGYISNKLVLKIVSYLVRGIYACSDTLLVQSKAFIEPVSRLSNYQKIKYFPNFIHDMKAESSETEQDSLPENIKIMLQTNFCLVFAGNIGTAQSMETLISTAQQLSGFPDIKIIIVGNGSMLEWTQQQVELLQLENVVFTGSFPIDTMPSIFSRAKALLVSLKAEEIFSYTIPSKIQAYLSAGRPIIASIDGEAARIINHADAGLTCRAEDASGLAEKIIQFFNMSPSQHETLGNNGRKYFLENFEINQQCKRLIEIIEDRVEKERVGQK